MIKIVDNSKEYDDAINEDVGLDKLAELNTKVIDGIKYYRFTESLKLETACGKIEEFGFDPETCVIIISKDDVTTRNPDGRKYILYTTEHESFEEFYSHMILTED